MAKEFLASIWHRLTTTRYTILLEDEVERLRQQHETDREEIRALMNSILTRAGVQPIDPRPPVDRMQRRMSRYQLQQKIERDAMLRAEREAQKDERGANGAAKQA